MGLETATYLADLNSTNPPNTDNVSQGDDHIRLLKAVLQATFPSMSGVWTAVAHTFTAAQTFSGSGSVAVPIELISTNADANIGPVLSLYRNSGSVADGDIGGGLYFYSKDSAGNKDLFAAIRAVLTDIDSTTEDADLQFGAITAGSFAYELGLSGAALYPVTSAGLNLGTASLLFGAAYLTTLELGHASDTTFARSAAGVVTVEGNTLCRIKTGTYTGDGATSKAITGVGFQPKFVKIWVRTTVDTTTNVEIIETTDVIIDDIAGGGAFNYLGALGTATFADDMIIALGSDGFTVDDGGSNSHPNKSGSVYNYLCLG